jgi:hypothetical protein
VIIGNQYKSTFIKFSHNRFCGEAADDIRHGCGRCG